MMSDMLEFFSKPTPKNYYNTTKYCATIKLAIIGVRGGCG